MVRQVINTNTESSSSSSSSTPNTTGMDFGDKSAEIIGKAKALNWKSILLCVLIFTVIILVLSIIVHYVVTPIYKLRPGAPGLVLLNGYDDGKLYWTSTPSRLSNKETNIASNSHNYTLLLDIYIKQPSMISNNPRIIFYRGEQATVGFFSQDHTSLLGMIPNYNICMALLPDTNDLLISVLNSQNNMENVILYNVPVQASFRVGVVLVDRFMEVYMNGKLVRTRQFSSPPKHVLGDFFPPGQANSIVTSIGNLHLWNSILTAAEIKEATPSLFSPEIKQSAPSCSSSVSLSSSMNKII